MTPTSTSTPNTVTVDNSPPKKDDWIVILRFSLMDPFDTELLNPMSAAFKRMVILVVIELDRIYSRYPNFYRAYVFNFYAGSTVVNSTLIFNNTKIPQDKELITTLYDAWRFNSTVLNLVNNTIYIDPLNPTTAMTTTPTTTTTTTTRAPVKPPTPEEKTVILKFSLAIIFTNDLKDPTSPVFITLAIQVELEINVIFLAKYPLTYRRCIINGFTAGSVIVNATLIFDNHTLPTNFDITQTLVENWNSTQNELQLVNGTVFIIDQSTSASGPPVMLYSAMALLLSTAFVILHNLSLL
ncbi:hypothetical protein NFI96_025468 [Prochilodus magdalenae]|nr:hypothetical protein NFI96_025468 [Prochilodus magdalenae]